MERKYAIRTGDGRYVSKIDTVYGSNKVLFALDEDSAKAVVYPSRKRADEDCRLFNHRDYKYGRIRKRIEERYGDITFHVEELG